TAAIASGSVGNGGAGWSNRMLVARASTWALSNAPPGSRYEPSTVNQLSSINGIPILQFRPPSVLLTGSGSVEVTIAGIPSTKSVKPPGGAWSRIEYPGDAPVPTKMRMSPGSSDV